MISQRSSFVLFAACGLSSLVGLFYDATTIATAMAFSSGVWLVDWQVRRKTADYVLRPAANPGPSFGAYRTPAAVEREPTPTPKSLHRGPMKKCAFCGMKQSYFYDSSLTGGHIAGPSRAQVCKSPTRRPCCDAGVHLHQDCKSCSANWIVAPVEAPP